MKVLFLWYQCCVRTKSLLLHYKETVEVDYMYSVERKKIISHEIRSVFYKGVCNNKLFDCHHSDNNRYI